MKDSTIDSVMKKVLCIFLMMFTVSSNLTFAASDSTSAEPYKKEEFSPVLHDIRRAEIITFGSLPFVTLGVTVAYGAYGYFSGEFSSFPNPLDKSADSFSSWQQAKIFGVSLGISAGLGLIDFGVNIVRRHNRTKKERARLENSRQIHVIPYREEFIREGGFDKMSAEEYEDDEEQEELSD